MNGTYAASRQVVPWVEGRVVAPQEIPAAGGAITVEVVGQDGRVTDIGGEGEGQIVQLRPWEGYGDNFFYYLSGVD